jgi:ATP-binding cassette subfamily C protein CydD
VNRELLRQVGSARVSLGATVGIGVLVAVATIFQMVSLAKVVNLVFVEGGSLGDVKTPLSLLLAASVLRSVLLWAREVTAQRGAVRVKSELRERLFGHLMKLGPAHAKGERTGELATTATEGVERLDAYFARYLPQMVLSVLVPLLIAIYVFPLDWSSAVLLLATAPVIPVMMILVGSYAEEHVKRQWTALSRLGAHFLDAVQGLKTLKVLGRSEAETEKVAAASEGFRSRTMKVLRYAFLSGFVLEFITAMAIALVAVTLGVRVVSGNMPFEEAFVVLLLAPEFYKPLRELGVHRHAGMEGSAAAERIFEILNTPLPVSGGPKSGSPEPGGLTVEFSGLGYAYPTATVRRSRTSRSRWRLAPGPPSSGAAGPARARSSTFSCASWTRLQGRSWLTAFVSPTCRSRPGGRTWRWCRSARTCSTAACSRTSGWPAPGRPARR